MNKYITISLIVLLLAGCATSQPPSDSVASKQPPAGESTTSNSSNFMTNRFATESNVWQKASMKIAFPELNHSISATIEIAKMDSLLISISAMFGISVGKLFATPTEFIMNNNLENVTYTGSPTRENIMEAAFIDLSYSDLLCILKCVPTQNFAQYSYNISTNSYILEEDSFREEVFFTGKDTLTKIIRTDKNGNEILIVDYSNHLPKGAYLFASNIILTFPQVGGMINIVLTDIQIDKALTSPMRLSKPKSYKLINSD